MVLPPIVPIKIAAVNGVDIAAAATTAPRAPETSNVFDNILSRAVESLNGVSQAEMNANQLIDKYVSGKAELSDVMLATSKMTIAVNLAVTTITTAVSSFKEVTQMAI
jgi:flagellar hook-basal body complex protein FliE